MKQVKNIIYEKDDGVAKITINRPPLNILNVETLREIAKALEDIGKDDSIKVLVITGAGEKTFSAGVEIKDHLPDKIRETLGSFWPPMMPSLGSKRSRLGQYRPLRPYFYRG